jgi:hypothetical protein
MIGFLAVLLGVWTICIAILSLMSETVSKINDRNTERMYLYTHIHLGLLILTTIGGILLEIYKKL